MKLAVSQEVLEKEVIEEQRIERLESKIRDKEMEAGEHERQIAVLESRYSNLQNNIKITFAMVLVVVGIFIYIATNAAYIVYRFIASTYLFVIVIAAVVSFIAYVIKRAAKEVPMYIHCRQEERGISNNTTNYLYRIKLEKQKLCECRKDIDLAKQELNNLIENTN